MTRSKNGHGGDWASYEIEYGNTPLDFSMNVNPLGISERVQAAIAEAASSADRYPDPECRQLREAIAKAEGVAAERIFCGAGAADIIYRLAKTAKKDEEPRLLITAPTFSEYEEAFASEGWRVERWLLREDLSGPFRRDLSEDTKKPLLLVRAAFKGIFDLISRCPYSADEPVGIELLCDDRGFLVCCRAPDAFDADGVSYGIVHMGLAHPAGHAVDSENVFFHIPSGKGGTACRRPRISAVMMAGPASGAALTAG